MWVERNALSLSTIASSRIQKLPAARWPSGTYLFFGSHNLHSYATAYWWAAGFFAAGLVISLALYRKGKPFPTDSDATETGPEVAGESHAGDEDVPVRGTVAAADGEASRAPSAR